MKKLISALMAVVLLVPFIKIQKAEAINFPLKTSLNSESAILLNLDTNTIIHEKNADTTQMPGPLVNIMTAVVCLENCDNLSEEIIVSESLYTSIGADNEDVMYIDIYNGDILTVSDLIYAMMLTSSMEASQTLAYRFGEGSVNKFVNMMNEKAAEIGLESTHFTNPTGLYDEKQYTTARDMMKLTQYALSVPLFETMASPYEYNPSVPNLKNHEEHNKWLWHHTNPMLDPKSEYYYQGAKGIKTANLERYGRNLVSMASRDGNNYLVVLLRAPFDDPNGITRFYHVEDATALFNWAFKYFSYQVILPDTAELGEIPVSLASGNDYVLAKPEEEVSVLWYDELDTSTINKDNIVWYKKSLQAPVSEGELLGQLTLEYAGETLGTVNLVAVSDVERSWAKYNLFAAAKFPKSNWFRKAIIVSIILCALYVLMCIYSLVIFKNKSKPVKPKYTVPKVEKNKKKKK